MDRDFNLPDNEENKEHLGSLKEKHIDSANLESDEEEVVDVVTEKQKQKERKQATQAAGFVRTFGGTYLLIGFYKDLIKPLLEGTLDLPLHIILLYILVGILGVYFVINGVKKL